MIGLLPPSTEASTLMLPHQLKHCSAGNQSRRPALLAGRLPLAGLSPVNSRTDPSMPKHSQIPSFLCIHTNSGLRSDLDPRSCYRSAGRPILDPTASSLRSCGDRSGTSSNSDTIGLRRSARRRAIASCSSAADETLRIRRPKCNGPACGS